MISFRLSFFLLSRLNSGCDTGTFTRSNTLRTRRKLATPPQSPMGRRSQTPNINHSPYLSSNRRPPIDSPSLHNYETVDTPLKVNKHIS